MGGYIPNCWAAFKRSQESLKLKSSLVTDREFDFVDGALARITDQLRNKRRDLQARGDKYRSTFEPAIDAFSKEVEKVQETRDRLATLRKEKVDDTKVYGELSKNAEALADNLLRWEAHPENRVAEQLAMAPTAVESDHELFASILGRPIGAPHTLDIDSIV